MTTSAWRRLFAKTSWRGWLERLRQWEQAMDYDDIELLELRVREVEMQVRKLQKKVR